MLSRETDRLYPLTAKFVKHRRTGVSSMCLGECGGKKNKDDGDDEVGPFFMLPAPALDVLSRGGDGGYRLESPEPMAGVFILGSGVMPAMPAVENTDMSQGCCCCWCCCSEEEEEEEEEEE